MYEKAEMMFLDCLVKREVVLGAEHPDTIYTGMNIEKVRGKMLSPVFRSSM